MVIDPTPPSPTPVPAGGTFAASSAPKTDGQTASSATPPSFVGEEFSQFLELLTTQVENQDPLKPLDSTQFVEQLATFSALEQQVQSNQYLKSILEAVEAA